jgi:hypothetical protein
MSILREEIIRHGGRASRFSYRLLVLGAIFVLLAETRESFRFQGIEITNTSLVLALIPPAVGFMLIQVVDSLFIRQRYITILESLVAQTMPQVSEKQLGYVFVPYNFPPSQMLLGHRRKAGKCLICLEYFTSGLTLLLGSVLLIYMVYALHHRSGFDLIADFSIAITIAAVVRTASAIVGLGVTEQRAPSLAGESSA